ncbi:inositol polyphosphate 1-phosphatase isoform X2 [Euwallacea fornicatus]|uniref:inositol polyphosphate 1-phosphatase isoform X2 n=1 Tax=Euwallacea fornicatus TaxID=995702 RepID=UPI00338FC866
MDLLKTLIIASEKAANIARLLRKNDKLFEKLVEQKSSAEANPRFQEDFKTLADVLIQEMVKHDVGLKFPEIHDRVYGEENNHFFSVELGKEIVVKVKGSKEETSDLLAELMNNDREAANLLADEVHREVKLEDINTKHVPHGVIGGIDVEHLSIWIDPIDGTNEYVKGGYEQNTTGKFYSKGLKCVTVLIGVFNTQGRPVMGVINQPFLEAEVDLGFQCHWGVCPNTSNKSSWVSSCDVEDWKETNNVCLGENENEAIRQSLKNDGYNLVISRGAGYKLLTVVLDAYVLSKGTTFLWDTCGPHAILSALGGGIVEWAAAAHGQNNSILYNCSNDGSKCNEKGIIAYRNERVLERLLRL